MYNDPFEIKLPSNRWAPGKEQVEAANQQYEKLLPPLVHKIREAVAEWRDAGYPQVTDTTRALLEFWFNQEHSTKSWNSPPPPTNTKNPAPTK